MPLPQPLVATKATPAFKTTRPPQRGGMDGGDDPIVDTKVHVPHQRGVEVGTVRGVHPKKAGFAWMEYARSTTLYEVARNVLFPSSEANHEHLERVHSHP